MVLVVISSNMWHWAGAVDFEGPSPDGAGKRASSREAACLTLLPTTQKRRDTFCSLTGTVLSRQGPAARDGSRRKTGGAVSRVRPGVNCWSGSWEGIPCGPSIVHPAFTCGQTGAATGS